MSSEWLKSVQKSAENRIALREKYSSWLAQHPEIKEKVDGFEKKAVNHLMRAGIASTAAGAGLLVTPYSFVIMAEFMRQMRLSLNSLKDRNKFIKDNFFKE
jgi:hypothetical protein